ncbi:MAG: arsenic efflux protein [Firmicutes bacterium]|nr:arsenic efflux protein [Bacillota bacterium]
MDIFFDVLEALGDAGLDTLILLPFLLAVHLLIEWFEYSAASRMRFSKMLNGWYAPAAAAGLGLVPQCGFSVVATKLFSKRNIRLGTLLAVYIATSDEAIPILISNPDAWGKILPLLGIKLVFAIAAGYVINALMRARGKAGVRDQGLGVRGQGSGVRDQGLGEDDCAETIGCHGHRLGSREQKSKDSRGVDSSRPSDINSMATIGCHGHVLKSAEVKKQNAEAEESSHHHHASDSRCPEPGDRACFTVGASPTAVASPRPTGNQESLITALPRNSGQWEVFSDQLKEDGFVSRIPNPEPRIPNSESRAPNPESRSTARKIWGFLSHPILHTLTIGAFILAVNIAFSILFKFVGEEAITDFLNSAAPAQPFIAGLVGLIPNCGGSVVITQAYALGGLTLGAAVTGLSVSAGVAYAVLFKENKNLKQNLLIIGGLYAASCLLGLGITLIGG